MSPVYPTVKIYIDNNGDGIPETDISSKVVSNISGQYGIMSANEGDRTPAAGKITFELENKDGDYEFAAALVGRTVSVTLTYARFEKQVFFGYVTPSSMDSGPTLPLHVKITVSDWFHSANNSRTRLLALETFKRANEALTSLINTTANPPAFTNFDTGTEVFSNMFDAAGSKAKVYSELDKIIKSELGYIYLRFRDTTYGETLRMENKYARGSARSYTDFPINVLENNDYLKHSEGAGGFLKFHGPAGEVGQIKLSEFWRADLGIFHYDANWTIGKNVVNEYSVTNTVRKTDTSLTTIYSLGSPIPIGTSEKVYINANYTNPTGGSIISAANVQTPASGIDILFVQNQDGTGTNYISNLAKTFHAGATGFSQGFLNFGPPGYLVFFRVQGYGIYKYNPVETVSENTESKEDILRTEISDSLTREYSSDIRTSKLFADKAVALYRHPLREMLDASYHANNSEMLLLAFMFLDIGDKALIEEVFPEHSGDFYIQGIKFSITLGGIVDYTYYLKEEVKTLCRPIVVKTTENAAGKMNAVDFGVNPLLGNMSSFTYSFWIRKTDTGGGAYGSIIDRSVDPGDGTGRRGCQLFLNTDGTIDFYSYKTPTDGHWVATAALVSYNVWHHVVISYDNTSAAADPQLIIDGSLVSMTETSTPVGTTDNDSDCPLILFNVSRNPATPLNEYYQTDVSNIALKDVRIYNRLLTLDEVTELFESENILDVVPTGLVFHGIYAPIDNIDDYVDTTIENDDWVLESVYGLAGIPYNNETTPSSMLSGEDI